MSRSRRRHTVAVLLVALAWATSACQAGGRPVEDGSPVAGPAAATDGQPSATSSPVLSVPVPTPTPTEERTTEPNGAGYPDEPIDVPIAEDEEFAEAAAAVCRAVRPADVESIRQPTRSPVKAPGYQGLHIVVLEMARPDGSVGPPPALPAGQSYWPTAPFTFGGSEALWVEAVWAWQVDLLACVALRTGRSETYTINNRQVEVTAVDAIIWMVDRTRRALVGQAWVAESDLAYLINADNLLAVDGARLLPADVRAAVAYFMGLAVPHAGAYQGGEDGYVVAEFDAPFDLPAGTRLLPGHTFVVRLVVLTEGTGVIDFIDVLCAPVRVVSGPPLRVAVDVPHDVGLFSAASADIEIEGEFLSDNLVVGRIHALSEQAAACGIPRSAAWQAAPAASARAAGDGYELYLP